VAVNIGPCFWAFTSVGTNFGEIARLLDAHGVVGRRAHPELDSTLQYLASKGALTRVLPGVYAAPAAASSLPVRIAALIAYDPDAILTEAAAAKVSFWPDIKVGTITCAVRHRRQPQRGFAFSRRVIPDELVTDRSGLRYTSVALTALDLCESHGGDGIDHALRRRRTTLALLHRAMDLTADRVGNRVRRQLLLDSRDEPWSAAERRLHRLLRAAGITGWRANQGLLVEGATYHPDALFRLEGVILEVDGREFHSEPKVFESDRWRQNLLVLDGWCVLRFTWRMLEERPEEVLAVIRRALAMRVAGQQSMAAANWIVRD
jgi:very-short-patch-repair endonuclease